MTAPLVLGHESSGIVQECGAGVTSLKPGDRVALEPGVPCRYCEYCRGGRYNLCPDMRFAATPPYDGTLAAYFAVPEDFCYKLPENVSLEEGALVEPLSVAVHCARLGNVSFGSTVLVLGAGPIGLLCCAVATALGASKVATADIDTGRLELARRYAGASTYTMKDVEPRENAALASAEFQPWAGADVVIDATGVGSCISTGIHLMKPGGTFVQAGLGAENITFPVAQLCSKEGTYRGSFRYSAGDYKTAVEFLRQGRVSVKELITHRFGFSEAREAFQSVAKRTGIKAVISGPLCVSHMQSCK